MKAETVIHVDDLMRGLYNENTNEVQLNDVCVKEHPRMQVMKAIRYSGMFLMDFCVRDISPMWEYKRWECITGGSEKYDDAASCMGKEYTMQVSMNDNQFWEHLEQVVSRVFDTKIKPFEEKFDNRIDSLGGKFEKKIDDLDAKFEKKFDYLDAKLEKKFDYLDA